MAYSLNMSAGADKRAKIIAEQAERQKAEQLQTGTASPKPRKNWASSGAVRSPFKSRPKPRP